jgi:hypothetical protein
MCSGDAAVSGSRPPPRTGAGTGQGRALGAEWLYGRSSKLMHETIFQTLGALKFQRAFGGEHEQWFWDLHDSIMRTDRIGQETRGLLPDDPRGLLALGLPRRCTVEARACWPRLARQLERPRLQSCFRLIGWRHVSDPDRQARPRSFYALLAVLRITHTLLHVSPLVKSTYGG